MFTLSTIRTHPLEQLYASIMEDSRLPLDTRIFRVLTADGDHRGVKHWRHVQVRRGKSMDDGESGMKDPPVIVKIMLKRVGVCYWTHTVWLLSKEDYAFLFISQFHRLWTEVVRRHRVNVAGERDARHGVRVRKARRGGCLVARRPRVSHGGDG